MTRFIHLDFTKRNFQFLEDYTNESASSIDLALQSVYPLVDRLDYYLQQSKQLCHFPSEYNLTKDESIALYIYTYDWGEKNLEQIICNVMQSNNPSSIEPWAKFLKLLNNALEKIPNSQTRVWRLLPLDIAEKLEENDQFVLSSMITCSLSLSVIKPLLDRKTALCSIESLNGKDIHSYSFEPSRNEVLLCSGTRLRVKRSCLNDKQSKPIIYLEEIDDFNQDQPFINDIDVLNAYNFDNGSTLKNVTQNYDNIVTTVGKRLSKQRTVDEDKIKALIYFRNGDQYKIIYRNKIKYGHGKYCSILKEKFHGKIADENATGEGLCIFPNGDRFIGTFRHGERHGHGILLTHDNLIEACDWVNDKPHGSSLKINTDSGYYEWRSMIVNERWYCAYNDENGNKYIGNMVDGIADGLGLQTWSDNNRYEGNFKQDSRHGYGILYYVNGDQYKGEWENDEMTGEGIFRWKNGSFYVGKFVNGKRHGFGKLMYNDGSIREGVWNNDDYAV